MRLLLGWAINAAALFLLPYLVPAVQVSSFGTALVVALVIGALLLRVSKTRRALIVAGETPEGVTTSAGLIYVFAGIAVVVSLFALVIGYVTMARFITYEMVWIFIVFAAFYLASGVAAATVHALANPGSLEPAVGASGAVAGLMGAFAVGHARTPMRLALVSMVTLSPRVTFLTWPAGAFLALWVLEQVFYEPGEARRPLEPALSGALR